MTNLHEFSDGLLQAYVDGELDQAEVSAMQQAMEQMPELKKRVCQLQHLKASVNNAFPIETSFDDDHEPEGTFVKTWVSGLSGVAVGGLVVALGFTAWGKPAVNSTAAGADRLLETSISLQQAVAPKKVVLHIDSNDATRLGRTVSYTEELLGSYDKADVEVEVLVNAGGIELFNSNGSLYRARLDELSSKYDNLELIACANAIARVRERGETVNLLPQARTDVTALDHVVKRLQEGWSYLKI